MRPVRVLVATIIVAAIVVVLVTIQLQPKGSPLSAQIPTATPTPHLGGTGYYLSLPGSCPGAPLLSIPAHTSELQVNIVWDEVPTDKARFRLGQRTAPEAAPLMDNDLLFERVGSELYRCATVTRSVTYTTSGLAYFHHLLQAVDDQGHYISVTPNPAEMETWSFEAVETVEPVSTPMDPEYGVFEMEVSTAPVIYTRPDGDFDAAPVDHFSTSDTVYLLQPPPCPADYTVVTVTGPQGYYWEEGRGHFCRSYAGVAYEIGSSLPVGDYEASAVNEGFAGAPMYVWHFDVSP